MRTVQYIGTLACLCLWAAGCATPAPKRPLEPVPIIPVEVPDFSYTLVLDRSDAPQLSVELELTGGLKGGEASFTVRAFSTVQEEALWTYTHNDLQVLQVAFALAIGAVRPGRAISHANATCAGLASRRLPTSSCCGY